MKKFIERLGKTKFIILCVVIVALIIIVPSGIKCAVYQESPAQLIADTFTPNSKQIVGKWQGDSAVTAYEFYEDGTYDSYISTFCYKGKYEIDSNRITLTNSNFSGSVVYKFSINGNKLTMKLDKENGGAVEEKTKTTFTKVDTITMQSISDILSELTTAPSEE